MESETDMPYLPRMRIASPEVVSSGTVGPAAIQPSTFGLLSTSLLNVSKFRDGRVTAARLVTRDGKYALHMFTGTARQPRRWEESGWAPPAPQLPSLELTPDCGMDEL